MSPEPTARTAEQAPDLFAMALSAAQHSTGKAVSGITTESETEDESEFFGEPIEGAGTAEWTTEQVLAWSVRARTTMEAELDSLPAYTDGWPFTAAGTPRRRLFLRLVPDACAELSVAMRDLDDRQRSELVEEFMASHILWAHPHNDLASELWGVLDSYSRRVGVYAGWTQEAAIRTASHDLLVHPWRRPDGKVAADFMAFRPEGFDPAVDEYPAVAEDCAEVFRALDDEYWRQFLGLRFIVHDGRGSQTMWLPGW